MSVNISPLLSNFHQIESDLCTASHGYAICVRLSAYLKCFVCVRAYLRSCVRILAFSHLRNTKSVTVKHNVQPIILKSIAYVFIHLVFLPLVFNLLNWSVSRQRLLVIHHVYGVSTSILRITCQ